MMLNAVCVQNLIKNYEQDMETLTKQQKQAVEKAELMQQQDMKTTGKRIKGEQVRQRPYITLHVHVCSGVVVLHTLIVDARTHTHTHIRACFFVCAYINGIHDIVSNENCANNIRSTYKSYKGQNLVTAKDPTRKVQTDKN